MALWSFGKKKDRSDQEVDGDTAVPTGEVPQPPAAEPQAEQGEHEPTPTEEPQADIAAEAHDEDPALDPVHDAVTGDTGPFDGDSVDIEAFDFSDFAKGVLNLGSLLIPLPKGSEVQVEMGEKGPRMLHVVTKFGRITPVAFAAPRSAGQWREATKEIAEGMRKDGLTVRIEKGPWGREVVGDANDRQIRIIGVDGPRWMLRLTMIAPTDRAEDMRDLGREVAARTFVKRGESPILAGSPLPVALPQPLVDQVQEAMKKRAEQQKAAPTNPPTET